MKHPRSKEGMIEGIASNMKRIGSMCDNMRYYFKCILER